MKYGSFIFLILLLCNPSNGSTWYVRPLIFTTWSGDYPVPTAGVYGDQDGTSYADAWNGLHSVVWGVSGVNTGDTLYICGTNIARYIAYDGPNVTSYKIPLIQSGVTLRGDYPGDSGLIFGGAIDGFNTYTWIGPDANGVYRSYCGANSSWFVKYEIVSGAPVILNLASNTTWEGNLGSHYGVAGTSNYVKTISGGAPVSSNLALAYMGWNLFITNGTSNIVFQSLSFYGGGLTYSTPDYASDFLGAKYVSFTNCTFLQGREDGPWINPLPGHDNWNIVGCEIGYTPSGIYAFLNNQTRGAWGWNVIANYIHDCGTINWTGDDNHAIGVQGGSSWVVMSNRTERTGTAIDFWTGLHQAQTNNRVCYNFIKDVSKKNSSGHGITFEGTTGQDPGLASNNVIYGNIILNVGIGTVDEWEGAGIDWEQHDYTEIYNNTVVNACQGLQFRVSAVPLLGKLVNNLILNPRTNFLYISSSVESPDFVVNFNLFYTNSLLAVPFHIDNPGFALGANCLFSDPLLASTSPVISSDFRLKSGSPAINAGTNVGLPYCQSSPDIGAFEFCNQMLLNTINARNIRISP